MTSAARGPNSSASRPITGAPIGVVPKKTAMYNDMTLLR